jgi:hypothetical protein
VFIYLFILKEYLNLGASFKQRLYKTGKNRNCIRPLYKSVSKSFRTGRLERELQMVQLSATRCSCIAILWVSVVSCAAITLFVASEQVIPKVSLYFFINSVWKLLDTPSYEIYYKPKDE